MDIRDGDTVLVRMKVRDDCPMNKSQVVVLCIDTRASISRSDIVSVEPRPLQVGDKVTWAAGDLIGELRFVTEQEAVAQVISDIDGFRPDRNGKLVTLPLQAFKRHS